MKTDTIAAIATAVSDSGIGIIRVSGADAIAIVNCLFRTKSGKKSLMNAKSHTIQYGFIVDSSDETVDEVMVSVMKAPKSYTTEDIVEINCHGGILLVNRILSLVIQNGAKAAAPGEFTKRAFLNGRIDLSQAEAVMDLIHSQNKYALKSSVSQLKGSLKKSITAMREKILYEIAFIESALDDPEHISLDGYLERLHLVVIHLCKQLQKLLDTADDGQIIKEGIQTVILGKPNAGKSSLLNILTGEDKAIVTDIAGTTRDVLEESIKISGISLNIMDTAGIRKTEDLVEKIGVEKAKKYALIADLIVYVLDASVALDENDEEIFELIKDKKCIILFNKTDLNSVVDENQVFKKLRNDVVLIKTSIIDNRGIDEFADTIKKMFFAKELQFNDEVYITNARHLEAIENAYESMKLVEKSIKNQMPEDFYSIDLMSAFVSLGTVIGEEVGEDLVNEIFSKFCMGK